MTAAGAASAEGRLRELYGRYKRLSLAAGAALVLDVHDDALEPEASALLADARAAAAADGMHAHQLEACVEAAAALHDLVAGGDGEVEAVRETHRRLRREVWKVIPCEYVPCCAPVARASMRRSNG